MQVLVRNLQTAFKKKKDRKGGKKNTVFFLVLLFVDINIHYCFKPVNNILCGFLHFFAKLYIF